MVDGRNFFNDAAALPVPVAPDTVWKICHACGGTGTNSGSGSSSSSKSRPNLRNDGGGDAMRASPMSCYAVRLRPGEELKSALAVFTWKMGLRVRENVL